MHLSLVEGCDVSSDKLGEVVLQDAFSVWDPKQLIRKGRDRHIFLFELYLLFTKEVKDSAGKVKYIYKNKLMVIVSKRRYTLEVVDNVLFLDLRAGGDRAHGGGRV